VAGDNPQRIETPNSADFYLNIKKTPSVKLKNHDLGRE
jgi:hypothetical protein